MTQDFDYFMESLRSRVYELAKKTPLQNAKALSEKMGNQIWLKREDMHEIFSFKVRGSYNCIAHHVAAAFPARISRVITASAGNHAQGVALSASALGLKSTIVMSVTTPQIKIDAVIRLGGKVVLSGDNFAEAYAHASKLADSQKNSLFVHPFNDNWVIAGQGTVALEIINQHPGDLEAIFVPVGGGGLLAGICACIKKIRPSIKVIGVEPEDAAALYQSLQAGRRVKLSNVGLFADGVAISQIGELPYKVIKEHVDDVVVVNVDEICSAIELLYNDTRAIVEPAGAVALAGLRRYLADKPDVRDKHFVSIISGSNVNFNKLRYISERIAYSGGGEKLFAITVPERPGSFKRLARVLRKFNVTEFNYRDNSSSEAHVFCGLNFPDPQDKQAQRLLAALKKSGYSVVDMTDNELAKTHIRYTVGGRLSKSVNEFLFRMEFAEKPGALLGFLEQIPPRWSISLFHYRNHGSATGQVLCGLRVPEKIRSPLAKLEALGYKVVDETDNPAYTLFLR